MKLRPPSVRQRPQFEEIEPRILNSADAGALLHTDAFNEGAEVRMMDATLPSISPSTNNSNTSNSNQTQTSNTENTATNNFESGARLVRVARIARAGSL
jgi:hypothetical protein